MHAFYVLQALSGCSERQLRSRCSYWQKSGKIFNIFSEISHNLFRKHLKIICHLKITSGSWPIFWQTLFDNEIQNKAGLCCSAANHCLFRWADPFPCSLMACMTCSSLLKLVWFLKRGAKVNVHSTAKTCHQGAAAASDLYLPSPSNERQSQKVPEALLRDFSILSLHASFQFTAIALNSHRHSHRNSRFTVQLSERKLRESSRRWQTNCECVCWRCVSLWALTFPVKIKWIHYSWLCLYEAQDSNYWKLINKWNKTYIAPKHLYHFCLHKRLHQHLHQHLKIYTQ